MFYVGELPQTFGITGTFFSKRSDTAYRLSDSCIGTFRPCISPKHYQVDDKYKYMYGVRKFKTNFENYKCPCGTSSFKCIVFVYQYYRKISKYYGENTLRINPFGEWSYDLYGLTEDVTINKLLLQNHNMFHLNVENAPLSKKHCNFEMARHSNCCISFAFSVIGKQILVHIACVLS